MRIEAGEFEAALADVERAEREYREAMGTGGEMEAWRGDAARRGRCSAPAAPRRRWPRPRTLGGDRAAARNALAAAAGAARAGRRRGPRRSRRRRGEALDEATDGALAPGHAMTLRRIEATRAELVAA